MKKSLIPQLRFSEFEKVWKKENLQELCKKPISYGIVQTGENIKNGIPCVRVVDLTGVKLDVENMIKTSEVISNSYKKTILEENEVMLALRGDIGLVKLVEKNLVGANITRGVARISANENLINPFFLNWVIQSHKAVESINKQINGSALKEIPLGGLRKVSIFLSESLIEQQKIASFLTDVDDKITKLTKKKDLLEQYKKGIMQKIFNQELRFKDNNGNNYPVWEEKTLDNLGSTLNGLTGKTKENFGSGKPYIQYKQIFDSSKINIDNCGLVDITITDKQTKVQYGDVFFTTSSETPNEIGTASVLLDSVDEMYLNSFCFGFRVNQSILYTSFSQFLFRSSVFRKKMIPLAQGSTRYNISKSSFLKLKVYLPSIEEQTKIANFLSDIDIKIEALNAKIENSKSFKKGLLQQMFV